MRPAMMRLSIDLFILLICRLISLERVLSSTEQPIRSREMREHIRSREMREQQIRSREMREHPIGSREMREQPIRSREMRELSVVRTLQGYPNEKINEKSKVSTVNIEIKRTGSNTRDSS